MRESRSTFVSSRRAGVSADWNACLKADVAVLLLPCGRSAHLEAGYFVGSKKPLIVLLSDAAPELMYKMTLDIYLNIDEVVATLRKYFPA